MRSHRLVLALAAALAVSPVHQPATAAEVSAAAFQRGELEAFSGEELIASGHRIFGTASQGLAMTVQEAVRRWGEPNGYIVGQEASAAIFGGLRFGEGGSTPAMQANAGSTGKGRRSALTSAGMAGAR